ncbi:MAG: DUF4349 domain-containing protein, partial [Actinomycetota bacterium]|nr:DUF4349 domain-containing protein [Actinomycetota bacterium]
GDMKTEFEYLRQLETDLADAAVREASRAREAATPARRRAGHMWVKVAGAAAAFLVVAGAIGFVVAGDPSVGEKFDEVGKAVAGTGGGGAEAPAGPMPSPASEDDTAAPGGTGFLDEDAARRSLDSREGRQQQDLSKIVRDGRIGIVVPDGRFDDAVGDLTFISEQHGGFILSSATQNERSGTFVLRIPAGRFDRALADVRALGSRVKFQEIRGDDVTAEFIDHQARLRILKAERALLFDLFQQADTTEEILRMAGQLDDVRLRIEQIQGQLRFINDQVAESTLRVSIQERNAPEAAPQEEVDNPDLGSSFDLAVQGSLRIIGAVIVGLGYLIPLTVFGALVWIAIWFVGRRRATS